MAVSRLNARNGGSMFEPIATGRQKKNSVSRARTGGASAAFRSSDRSFDRGGKNSGDQCCSRIVTQPLACAGGVCGAVRSWEVSNSNTSETGTRDSARKHQPTSAENVSCFRNRGALDGFAKAHQQFNRPGNTSRSQHCSRIAPQKLSRSRRGDREVRREAACV